MFIIIYYYNCYNCIIIYCNIIYILNNNNNIYITYTFV